VTTSSVVWSNLNETTHKISRARVSNAVFQGGNFKNQFSTYNESRKIVCSGYLKTLNSHLSFHLIQ
jgi:hypothetical protein